MYKKKVLFWGIVSILCPILTVAFVCAQSVFGPSLFLKSAIFILGGFCIASIVNLGSAIKEGMYYNEEDVDQKGE